MASSRYGAFTDPSVDVGPPAAEALGVPVLSRDAVLPGTAARPRCFAFYPVPPPLRPRRRATALPRACSPVP